MKTYGIPTASFDITLGVPKPGKQDSMDLLSDSGFAFFCGIHPYSMFVNGSFGAISQWTWSLYSLGFSFFTPYCCGRKVQTSYPTWFLEPPKCIEHPYI